MNLFQVPDRRERLKVYVFLSIRNFALVSSLRTKTASFDSLGSTSNL